MRTLSPIRSVSPGPKPKIVFNYQPSPLRERPSTTNLTANSKQYMPLMPVSPNVRTNNFCLEPDVANQGKCTACPKLATYKVIKDNRLFCSSCAIGIMNRGLDVVRIEPKDQRSIKDFNEKKQKENTIFQPTPPKIKEFSETKSISNHREVELNELLSNILNEQYELRELLEKLNSDELTSEGIKAIYHEKKLGLKRHYEKIKAAIKLSIEKDLESLDRREKTSLQRIEEKKQELKDDIFLLQQIKQDIEPNKTQIVTIIAEGDYQKMLKQHREDTKGILDNKQISIKLIKELTSREIAQNPRDSEQVLQTHESVQSPRNQLYDPYTYTLIDSRQRKGETLFSFQRLK